MHIIVGILIALAIITWIWGQPMGRKVLGGALITLCGMLAFGLLAATFTQYQQAHNQQLLAQEEAAHPRNTAHNVPWPCRVRNHTGPETQDDIDVRTGYELTYHSDPQYQLECTP